MKMKIDEVRELIREARDEVKQSCGNVYAEKELKRLTNIAVEHYAKTHGPLLEALKSANIDNCEGCKYLTGNRGCLKGNNTQALSCCYHSIQEAIKDAENVEVPV